MSQLTYMKYNMEDLRLDLMDVGNRAEWRRRTRVADPSPEGFNPACRRERERVDLHGRQRTQNSAIVGLQIDAQPPELHCVTKTVTHYYAS